MPGCAAISSGGNSAAWLLGLLVIGSVVHEGVTAGEYQTQAEEAQMAYTTRRCLVRQFTYRAEHPVILDDGRRLECFGNVTVNSCWGRCDTSEVADYKVPYKISHHTSCHPVAEKVKKIRVPLLDCHPDHPDPFVDAISVDSDGGCTCSKCNKDITICETLIGD